MPVMKLDLDLNLNDTNSLTKNRMVVAQVLALIDAALANIGQTRQPAGLATVVIRAPEKPKPQLEYPEVFSTVYDQFTIADVMKVVPSRTTAKRAILLWLRGGFVRVIKEGSGRAGTMYEKAPNEGNDDKD